MPIQASLEPWMCVGSVKTGRKTGNCCFGVIIGHLTPDLDFYDCMVQGLHLFFSI